MMTPRWDIRPEIRRLGFRLAEVVCDWHFEIRGVWFCVRSGFRFDGASIPIPFCLIVAFPFTAWVWVPALIHDWFYRYHAERFAWILDGDGWYRPLTRREVDRAFLHALIDEINRIYAGTSRRKRYQRARRIVRARVMYAAVRNFAGWYWA
jgi:hypothetical protein